MKPVVVVEHLSRKYARNANQHLSYGIRDLFREIFPRSPDHSLRKDEFFAVDDVSFHLNRGESIGFVGRNGAGKTTLLKMMNGLIKPDAGLISIYGSVQALINLGAGFNASLSGRDNIINSASLIGLGHKASKAILDEVIDFSELEEFIDSPVGTYSSGMKARLGFAVAIHLKPDLLLVDEVLSVGDHAFRNKCFVKMHQLKKSGVSIVLVTHSPTHVVQLCERALWLHKGKLMKLGSAKETVQEYLDFLDSEEVERLEELNELRRDAKKTREQAAKKPSSKQLFGPISDEFDRIENLHVEFLVKGVEANSLAVHEEVVIKYGFTLSEPVTDLNVTLSVYRKDGLQINALSTLNGDLLKHIHHGRVECTVSIPDFNLNPGSYVLVLPIHEGSSYLYRDIVKEFVVTGNGRMTWHMVDFHYDYKVETPGEAM